MHIKQFIADYLPLLREFLVGLVPGALGATVAVAVQGAMTWTQRFLQLAVGIIVSYYATLIAQEMFDLSPVFEQGIGFAAGVGAYETAKNIRHGFADVARTAPRDVWEWWLARWDALFGTKK